MSELRSSQCPRCHQHHPPSAHDCAADAGQTGQSNVIPFRRNPETSAHRPEPDHEPDGPSAA